MSSTVPEKLGAILTKRDSLHFLSQAEWEDVSRKILEVTTQAFSGLNLPPETQRHLLIDIFMLPRDFFIAKRDV